MDFGIYLSIICFCSVLQIDCRNTYDDENKDYSTDTLDPFDILQVLANIVKIVAQALVKAINDIEDGIKEIQATVINDAVEAVNLLGDTIFDKLDQIKEIIADGNSTGAKIIDCLENRKEDIEQILIVFSNKTLDCATDRVNDLINGVVNLLEDVENIGVDLENALDEYYGCKNTTTNSTCNEKLMEKLTSDSNEWANEVTDTVKEIEKLSDEILSYLFECYNDNYNNMQVTTMEVYNGVVECIMEDTQ